MIREMLKHLCSAISYGGATSLRELKQQFWSYPERYLIKLSEAAKVESFQRQTSSHFLLFGPSAARGNLKNGNRLDIDELANSMDSQLSSIARLLDAAERNSGVARNHAIDEYGPGSISLIASSRSCWLWSGFMVRVAKEQSCRAAVVNLTACPDLGRNWKEQDAEGLQVRRNPWGVLKLF